MADILLADGFEHAFLGEDPSAFLVPGIGCPGAARAWAVTVAKGADAGLPPVGPRGAAVECPVMAFFAAGGSVGAASWVADVDDKPGKEGEEGEGYEEEFKKVERVGGAVVAGGEAVGGGSGGIDGGRDSISAVQGVEGDTGSGGRVKRTSLGGGGRLNEAVGGGWERLSSGGPGLS